MTDKNAHIREMLERRYQAGSILATVAVACALYYGDLGYKINKDKAFNILFDVCVQYKLGRLDGKDLLVPIIQHGLTKNKRRR